jgi:NAD(P)-dependent dehydrogenase (short-subunit alcohol dehydrogenase family)
MVGSPGWGRAMRRDLAGKRVIITGASGGIGRALAEQAVTAGARVIAAARSAGKLTDLVHQLAGGPGEVLAVPADVTSEADRQRLLDTAGDFFGGLDVLVNNAGIAAWGHFAGSSEEILRRIFEVNFFAPAELMRKAVPLLVRGVQPCIVNVASMTGRRAMPAWPEYSASKYALCGLTEALRGEFARFDIDVLLMVPGLTASDLRLHLLRNEGRVKIDFDKALSPETVAARIWHAVRHNKTETVIGRDARWMLLAGKLFPRLVDRLVARKVARAYAQ